MVVGANTCPGELERSAERLRAAARSRSRSASFHLVGNRIHNDGETRVRSPKGYGSPHKPGIDSSGKQKRCSTPTSRCASTFGLYFFFGLNLVNVAVKSDASEGSIPIKVQERSHGRPPDVRESRTAPAFPEERVRVPRTTTFTDGFPEVGGVARGDAGYRRPLDRRSNTSVLIFRIIFVCRVLRLDTDCTDSLVPPRLDAGLGAAGPAQSQGLGPRLQQLLRRPVQAEGAGTGGGVVQEAGGGVQGGARQPPVVSVVELGEAERVQGPHGAAVAPVSRGRRRRRRRESQRVVVVVVVEREVGREEGVRQGGAGRGAAHQERPQGVHQGVGPRQGVPLAFVLHPPVLEPHLERRVKGHGVSTEDHPEGG
ncbi:hypothetical protein EYF80_036747 [Liparis tanakae]|uniref:Uncharacterized protein n=1 Tax=Liparis tanakae TaxID=230148 RepID=A0A4Z2GJS8_9TELE|nr:hypothetical protein EYF80_036747 [Liparis tanakae]